MKNYLLIIIFYFFSISNLFALIKVDITRGNLDPLPIAVSPLHVESEAEKIENNSNQILDFTREIKNFDEEFKVKITESLWSIIYSDGSSDMYEDNFMRRLTGLLYLDKKIVGDIKERTKNKNK